MHIPDGFLNPKTETGLMGAALGALAFCMGTVIRVVTELIPEQVMSAAGNSLGNVRLSARRVISEIGEEKLKRMAQVASWIFAFQMFNFPINSGTSGHLIGGVFAAALLGPSEGMVVLSVVLAVQALLFGDGGLRALGANIINMAVVGSFLSYYIYAILKKWLPEIMSIAVAAWLSVVSASFFCAAEIGLSGTIRLHDVIPVMVKVHSLIGIAEALLTILLLRFFKEYKTIEK